MTGAINEALPPQVISEDVQCRNAQKIIDRESVKGFNDFR